MFDPAGLDESTIRAMMLEAGLKSANKKYENALSRLNDVADIADPYAEKAQKIRPTLFPVEALEVGILAFEDGAKKYGRDQWRTSDQVTRESIMDALERHWILLKKGESHAQDSKVHHIGHMIADLSILYTRFEFNKQESTK